MKKTLLATAVAACMCLGPVVPATANPPAPVARDQKPATARHTAALIIGVGDVQTLLSIVATVLTIVSVVKTLSAADGDAGSSDSLSSGKQKTTGNSQQPSRPAPGGTTGGGTNTGKLPAPPVDDGEVVADNREAVENAAAKAIDRQLQARGKTGVRRAAVDSDEAGARYVVREYIVNPDIIKKGLDTDKVAAFDGGTFKEVALFHSPTNRVAYTMANVQQSIWLNDGVAFYNVGAARKADGQWVIAVVTYGKR